MKITRALSAALCIALSFAAPQIALPKPEGRDQQMSADMADRPDNRAEEAKFLADMPGVLGAKAMAGLGQVQAVLGLDSYFFPLRTTRLLVDL
jgi:hypothetical protein